VASAVKFDHDQDNGADGASTVTVNGISVDSSQSPASVRQANGLNGRPVSPAKIATMSLPDIIRNDVLPLPQLVYLLLQVGAAAMSCPVEMEFAMDVVENERSGQREVRFSILQMRALAKAFKQTVPKLTMNEVPSAEVTACFSRQALGHGIINGITDIVYIKPDGFDPAKTQEIADQVGQLTSKLHAAKKPYVLIGPGRWGTHNPFLGVPVSWDQISGAACIVETELGPGQFSIPSQGSHFFQNITSFDIFYFTVNSFSGEGGVNYQWLNKCEDLTEIGAARHISLKSPIQVVVDGVSRCGVVMLPGHDWSIFVDQANAFLDLANLPCA